MSMFSVHVGDGPVLSAAIHNGHALRPDVAGCCALSAAARLREEDPFTDVLTAAAPTRLIVHRSRFETDLNRPRDKAVYREPCDAWGLCVWNDPPADALLEQSRANYDLFYSTARAVIAGQAARYGRVVILDIHSYNHRRDGADAPPADPQANPEVNLGTGSVDRSLWGPLVDDFLTALRGARVGGQTLDVRENVRFQGGEFCRWIHREFPGVACGLAIEFKKTFMDEWTGQADRVRLLELQAALAATVPVLEAALGRLAAEPVNS